MQCCHEAEPWPAGSPDRVSDQDFVSFAGSQNTLAGHTEGEAALAPDLGLDGGVRLKAAKHADVGDVGSLRAQEDVGVALERAVRCR
jgi:hypothetical protein